MNLNSNNKFFKAAFIAPLFLMLASLPAAAGFGISPPSIENNGLFQGDTHEQTIYLLRSKNDSEATVKASINVPNSAGWEIEGAADGIIFPAGSERLPLTLRIKAPESAKPGRYSGRADFILLQNTSVLTGVSVLLDITVISRIPKGRILIQAEANGEAWYVNPADSKRYYLGRPADAFRVMSGLSLGVKHSIVERSGQFPDNLLGRILLDVEDSGKAYYIYPVDKKAYYLGKPSDAFEIMKKFGLGISNSGLEAISRGDIL